MFPVFWIREFTERVPFTIAGDLFRLPVEYSTLNFWDSHNQFYSSSDTKELTVSFAAAPEALSHREHFVIQFISKLDLKLFVISGFAKSSPITYLFRGVLLPLFTLPKCKMKSQLAEKSLNQNDDVQNNVDTYIGGGLFRLPIWTKFLFYSQKPLFSSMSS